MRARTYIWMHSTYLHATRGNYAIATLIGIVYIAALILLE